MFVKSLFVFVVVVAQHYAATPPNGRPPTAQLRERHHLLERIMPHLGTLSKLIAYAWAALELAAPPPPTQSAPTPALVTGTALVLAGALLRTYCFRALGARFTFELAIRPAHALVTGGVYAVVRHPSYTGILALVCGWLVLLADYRPWAVGLCAGVFEDGGWDGVGSGSCAGMGRAGMVGLWVAVLATLHVVLGKRMDREDAMLEETFGDEWRAWAKRVRYRLVPGIV